MMSQKVAKAQIAEDSAFSVEHPAMSQEEFAALSTLFYSYTGITLPPSKKNLLVSRLLKRIKILGCRSFAEYYEYITGAGGQSEFVHAVDVVSTNKTEFFREPGHFACLREAVLPALCRAGSGQAGREVIVWSAGCSSGEEPYTLAMVLADFFKDRGGRSFSIVATDISHRMLEKAQRAVYTESDIQGIPAEYVRRYCLRGTKSQDGYYRIVPELRGRASFRYLNLMDGSWCLQGSVDIIFCRNVMIYFDQANRGRLVRRFYDQLAPGGYLFIGHSETLHGMDTDFKLVLPTVYTRT